MESGIVTPMLPFPPIERIVEAVIPRESAGLALLDYLCGRFDYLDRPQWQEQLDLGNLELDGVRAGGAEILRGGEKLFFQALGLVEQEVSWEISVLAETDDYIVVDKPGNLPCHPAGRFFNHTLWAWLKQVRHLDDIHFVSRIDRETSGIVLVAKNARFAARAAKQLHALGLDTRKEYEVLVHGRVPWRAFTAAGWLAPDRNAAVRKKRRFLHLEDDGVSDSIELPEDDEAVTCQTDFALQGFCRPPRGGEPPYRFVPDPQGGFSHLRAVLHTGRTHQIRATLCSLGYPIVGDKLYGLDERLFLHLAANALTDDDRRRLILPHQALHAARLTLPRLYLDLSCPPPFL